MVQFRVGSHELPNEQTRLVQTWPRVPPPTLQTVGNEPRYIFDCPHFSAIRTQYRTDFRISRAEILCSCGTKAKRLSAITSQTFCKWPRHEDRFVRISQAGRNLNLNVGSARLAYLCSLMLVAKPMQHSLAQTTVSSA